MEPHPPSHMTQEAVIEGQLSAGERHYIMQTLREADRKPQICIEVGTWLGGGSTLHILKALEENGDGHLWGIEADLSVHDQMIRNLTSANPRAMGRFTPLLGLSHQVIPPFLKKLPEGSTVDWVFLDGGVHPWEQIQEFRLLDPHMPVGSQILAHDKNIRKGKWFLPYIKTLDNWRVFELEAQPTGLLHATRIRPKPSPWRRLLAEFKLLLLQCEPFELLAMTVPHCVKHRLSILLPRKWVMRLAHGGRTA